MLICKSYSRYKKNDNSLLIFLEFIFAGKCYFEMELPNLDCDVDLDLLDKDVLPKFFMKHSSQESDHIEEPNQPKNYLGVMCVTRNSHPIRV